MATCGNYTAAPPPAYSEILPQNSEPPPPYTVNAGLPLGATLSLPSAPEAPPSLVNSMGMPRVEVQMGVHPPGVAFSTCAECRVKLENKGNPNAIKLDTGHRLMRGRNGRLLFRDGERGERMAIGPMWQDFAHRRQTWRGEQSAGAGGASDGVHEWNFIDVGAGKLGSDSIEVRLNDEGFIVWNGMHGDAVFDCLFMSRWGKIGQSQTPHS
jgi:hypothetical protein